MDWVTPEYGKKALYKAGKKLIYEDKNSQQYYDALRKLDNFLSSHAYLLNHIRNLLTRKASEVDSTAFVAQRLKRIPSIIGKLRQFSTMQLGKIQDIGGCRAVVLSPQNAYNLSNKIINSKIKCILVKKDDYIQNPKDSGYRRIHLVYKYIATSNNHECFNNLQIEIQIRTAIQHAWAKSVEILGTFLGQSLKTGENWRR